MLTVKGALLRPKKSTICCIKGAMSGRNLPEEGTAPLYTSALRGTVALILSPTPASLRAV